LIWVGAPAGYGKTWVVASWLQSRALTAIWYQCDEGDVDIASFFHFLTRAVETEPSGRSAPLPSLSPELLPALPTFVRNFMREFCAVLKPRTFIVLDNFQDVPEGAPLREMLPIAVHELPADIGMVVISRDQPAPNLTRLQSGADMLVLGLEDLTLTTEETEGLLARAVPRGGLESAPSAAELLALTQGWAAGISLLLQLNNLPVQKAIHSRSGSTQALFDYLSAEVFERWDETTRDFLLKTACLEYVSVPVARRITGNEAARDVLDALVRRNAFTLRRPTSDSYYYHPLFKQLLVTRATARFSADEHRELLISAAHSLAEHRDPEMAIRLLLTAEQWRAAAELLVHSAPDLVREGRFKTLADWIAEIPPGKDCLDAWLRYWRGVAELALGVPACPDTLNEAYALFVRHADNTGQMLATAALLQYHHVRYTDFAPMVSWIEILNALLHENPAFPSLGLEVHVLSGFLNACAQAHPTHPRLSRTLARLSELLPADIDDAARAAGLTALAHFYGMCGRTHEYRALWPSIEQLLNGTTLGPGARIAMIWIHAFHHFYCGDSVASATFLDNALQVARHHGLAAFELRVRLSQLQASDRQLPDRDLHEAIAQLLGLMAQAPPMVAGHGMYLQAVHLLAHGDWALAQQAAEAADAQFCRCSWVVPHAMTAIVLAEAHLELAEYAEAKTQLQTAADSVAGLYIPLIDFNAGLVSAEVARRSRSQPQFIAALRHAFSIGAEHRYAHMYHGAARLLPSLVPYALEFGIEVEYCRWLIQVRDLRAPAHDIADWPWPVRVRTLGLFQVQVNGEPLEGRGKAQRKPWELLKAILIPRIGVDVGSLLERVWPDLDGDAARNAFDLNLHRLRKLLRQKDAIILSRGRVLINPQLVWVDTWSFETLASTADRAADPAAHFRRLLKVYQGAFLTDDDAAWVIPLRSRLRAQFSRCIRALSESLRKQSQGETLAELLQATLEVEPQEEVFYRELMQALLALGRGAEAIVVYRRCEENLTRLLGAMPSPATRGLLPFQ
jgi:DNA-binding SARP family transcriptional activator